MKLRDKRKAKWIFPEARRAVGSTTIVRDGDQDGSEAVQRDAAQPFGGIVPKTWPPEMIMT
jgi:hypothetical protein